MIGTTSIACNTVILLSLSTDNLTKTFGVLTMTNIKTLTAYEVLTDWTSGQGATGKTPDTWEHVVDGQLHGKVVSIALLTAVAEMKTVGTVISFDEAIERGYLSKNHQDQHEVGKAPTKNNTLVTTKVNITAEQYKVNCIQLGLDNKNIEPVIDLIDAITGITSSTTKADLIDLLDSFKSLFINPEQEQTYKVKFEDEVASAKKFEALTSNSFSNIRTLSSGSYVACLALADLASVGLLAQLGYAMTATIPLPDGAFQISFKDTI